MRIYPYELLKLICDADMCMKGNNSKWRNITVKEVLEKYELNKDRIR